jgi:ABC-type antimicrobial peptide transport system permease subunit
LSLLPVQAAATLAGGLGLVALILVSIGIYGVVSYLVRQRTREIGIRLALGAERATVIRELVRQSMRWTMIGLAIGIAMSIAVTKLLSNLLYGVVPTDAVSFAVIVGVLFLTAYSAAFVPARRATDIDPAAALRHE